MTQIINLHPYIFPENAKESEQEKLMLQVLEKYSKSPQGSVNNKTTGDFRVWVYLHNKQGQTFNVAVSIFFYTVLIQEFNHFSQILIKPVIIFLVQSV